ncbi:hypothetical protein B0H16DRAFT_1477232 [Mycena metata]|uniref:Uncharacterized protein n=1 Tax=Mycena metata TaxID=1033252 RepID=A0AAD7H9C9_9AGAR|nr:hypothetical protein B0H16DRAFT_1477232 [Mycena metata]
MSTPTTATRPKAGSPSQAKKTTTAAAVASSGYPDKDSVTVKGKPIPPGLLFNKDSQNTYTTKANSRPSATSSGPATNSFTPVANHQGALDEDLIGELLGVPVPSRESRGESSTDSGETMPRDNVKELARKLGKRNGPWSGYAKNVINANARSPFLTPVGTASSSPTNDTPADQPCPAPTSNSLDIEIPEDHDEEADLEYLDEPEMAETASTSNVNPSATPSPALSSAKIVSTVATTDTAPHSLFGMRARAMFTFPVPPVRLFSPGQIPTSAPSSTRPTSLAERFSTTSGTAPLSTTASQTVTISKPAPTATLPTSAPQTAAIAHSQPVAVAPHPVAVAPPPIVALPQPVAGPPQLIVIPPQPSIQTPDNVAGAVPATRAAADAAPLPTVGTAPATAQIRGAQFMWTPVPGGGFPLVHGWDGDSVFEHMHDRQVSKWDRAVGNKLWVYEWEGKRYTEGSPTLEVLKAALARALKSPAPLIGPAEPCAGAPNSSPFLYLVRNLTDEQMQLLLDRTCWSGYGATFFPLPYAPTPALILLGSITGLLFSATTEHALEVANLVASTVRDDHDSQNFLAVVNDNFPIDEDPMTHFLASIRVSSVNRASTGNPPRLIWNVTGKPPSLIPSSNRAWIRVFEKLEFDSDMHYVGKVSPPLFCTGCKSYGHEYSYCAYPRLPGWHGQRQQPFSFTRLSLYLLSAVNTIIALDDLILVVFCARRGRKAIAGRDVSARNGGAGAWLSGAVPGQDLEGGKHRPFSNSRPLCISGLRLCAADSFDWLCASYSRSPLSGQSAALLSNIDRHLSPHTQERAFAFQPPFAFCDFRSFARSGVAEVDFSSASII